MLDQPNAAVKHQARGFAPAAKAARLEHRWTILDPLDSASGSFQGELDLPPRGGLSLLRETNLVRHPRARAH
jgi:hypothetical protein